MLNCEVCKLQVYSIVSVCLRWYKAKKKMQVTRKTFTRAAANSIFNRFSGDIIFSSLVYFASFVFLFFFACLFVCFFKVKIYILIHIRLCGWVSEKNFSPGLCPETRLPFFWPNAKTPAYYLLFFMWRQYHR